MSIIITNYAKIIKNKLVSLCCEITQSLIPNACKVPLDFLLF